MKIAKPELPGASAVPGVPADAKWVDRFLVGRDNAIKSMFQCLSGQVGFLNLNAELRTIQVFHGREHPIQAQRVKGRIQGVSLISSTADQNVWIIPRILSEDLIAVAAFVDNAPSEPFDISVVLYGP